MCGRVGLPLTHMLYAPPPCHMTQVFNADCSYHNKMRNKRIDHSRWQRVLGEGNVFALMPHYHTQKVLVVPVTIHVQCKCVQLCCEQQLMCAYISLFSPPQDPKGWLVECMNTVSSIYPTHN